jgi:stage II sporulation protein R
MKNTVFYAVVLLFATLLIAALPTDAEGEIYSDTLRLHILAESDSEGDQKIKLILRDRLLKEYGARLSDAESVVGAEEKICELLPEIEEFCARELRLLGASGEVRCTLTTEWYDTREYEDFTLPAGYYRSLRVIIGKGEGKNWWCVMYPPLCLDIATEDAPGDDAIGYTDGEIRLISAKGYNVKFKLLETISRSFRKFG